MDTLVRPSGGVDAAVRDARQPDPYVRMGRMDLRDFLRALKRVEEKAGDEPA